MESGYKVRWTSFALNELAETINYLEENWTQRELKTFASRLDHTIELISKNPLLFQVSDEFTETRRAVVTEHNSLYYRIKTDTVEVLSCFSNRKNPSKRKF
jgi:plasmid stabilization system protein ParE